MAQQTPPSSTGSSKSTSADTTPRLSSPISSTNPNASSADHDADSHPHRLSHEDSGFSELTNTPHEQSPLLPFPPHQSQFGPYRRGVRRDTLPPWAGALVILGVITWTVLASWYGLGLLGFKGRHAKLGDGDGDCWGRCGWGDD
ncbi:hypothetical protein P154DRAFT_614782 [Amniculicola lignicola CBS 123094]|uniref:Uncharacterized protein n=1 Tax=Amniculicola lignicola CBS 123094 TaxID=1392246 RepID=A0A6A5X3D4_9PLEO|nr:hypothetical protein P154DRAFT_614782 [Amniculicola lignicola CBS 123094]